MKGDVLATMKARARAVRTRAAVRSWQYRQRELASGVWFRLRRVLADAEAAYVIPDADATQLKDEGYTPESCGDELDPKKTILFVDASRLAQIADRRTITVGLGPEFLAARAIALVPFEGARSRPPRPHGSG